MSRLIPKKLKGNPIWAQPAWTYHISEEPTYEGGTLPEVDVTAAPMSEFRKKWRRVMRTSVRVPAAAPNPSSIATWQYNPNNTVDSTVGAELGYLGTALGAVPAIAIGSELWVIPQVKGAAEILGAADGVRNFSSDNGIKKTIGLTKEGKYGRAALSGLGDVFDVIGGYGTIKNGARFLGDTYDMMRAINARDINSKWFSEGLKMAEREKAFNASHHNPGMFELSQSAKTNQIVRKRNQSGFLPVVSNYHYSPSGIQNALSAEATKTITPLHKDFWKHYGKDILSNKLYRDVLFGNNAFAHSGYKEIVMPLPFKRSFAGPHWSETWAHEFSHRLDPIFIRIPNENPNLSVTLPATTDYYNFSTDRIGEYLRSNHGTELYARGTQIKNNLNKDILTGQDLKNYYEEVKSGKYFNNNMSDMFSGITDFNKFANMLTKGSYKNGGRLIPKAQLGLKEQRIQANQLHKDLANQNWKEGNILKAAYHWYKGTPGLGGQPENDYIYKTGIAPLPDTPISVVKRAEAVATGTKYVGPSAKVTSMFNNAQAMEKGTVQATTKKLTRNNLKHNQEILSLRLLNPDYERQYNKIARKLFMTDDPKKIREGLKLILDLTTLFKKGL